MFFIDESHNETRNAEVIQKVFRTMKQYLQVSKHNEAKNSYLTMVGNKDTSKKKLQLTIKSLSQRLLKVDQPADNSCSRAHEGEGLQMKMDRRQASCLFPREKCRGTR